MVVEAEKGRLGRCFLRGEVGKISWDIMTTRLTQLFIKVLAFLFLPASFWHYSCFEMFPESYFLSRNNL